jgi:IS5 family transposase
MRGTSLFLRRALSDEIADYDDVGRDADALVRRPPFEEGPVNPRDPDASFTVKNDKTYFGYKAHIAVDEESDLGHRQVIERDGAVRWLAATSGALSRNAAKVYEAWKVRERA